LDTTPAELYRNERFKFGSKEREDAEFADHVARVRAVQERIAREHFSGARHRVFHAKMHACLAGKLTLRPDRPASVRRGLFADGGKERYNVLARLSNGVGTEEHDLKPDVRGLALKIFGVTEAGAPASEPRCLDWLMTNSTNPFGRDQEEFVLFMEANAGSPADLAAYLARHPEVFALLTKAAARVIPSLAMERYWSGHPYLLGDDIAMKFNVAPVSDADPTVELPDDRAEAGRLDSLVQRAVQGAGAIEERVARWLAQHTPDASPLRSDYLRRDLLHRLSAAPLRFTLSVQLEQSPESTPIENTLVEWREDDAPSVPIADLVLARESTDVDAESLRFTPAHFIAAHRPLGNLARGRLFSYAASQEGRGAAMVDPVESAVFRS
jgi:catalase